MPSTKLGKGVSWNLCRPNAGNPKVGGIRRKEFSHGNDRICDTGAEGQNRTVDTGIFSAVLYQLSYLGRRFLS